MNEAISYINRQEADTIGNMIAVIHEAAKFDDFNEILEHLMYSICLPFTLSQFYESNILDIPLDLDWSKPYFTVDSHLIWITHTEEQRMITAELPQDILALCHEISEAECEFVILSKQIVETREVNEHVLDLLFDIAQGSFSLTELDEKAPVKQRDSIIQFFCDNNFAFFINETMNDGIAIIDICSHNNISIETSLMELTAKGRKAYLENDLAVRLSQMISKESEAHEDNKFR